MPGDAAAGNSNDGPGGREGAADAAAAVHSRASSSISSGGNSSSGSLEDALHAALSACDSKDGPAAAPKPEEALGDRGRFAPVAAAAEEGDELDDTAAAVMRASKLGAGACVVVMPPQQQPERRPTSALQAEASAVSVQPASFPQAAHPSASDIGEPGGAGPSVGQGTVPHASGPHSGPLHGRSRSAAEEPQLMVVKDMASLDIVVDEASVERPNNAAL